MPRRVTNRGRPQQTRGSRRPALTDSVEGLIMWLPPLEDLPGHSKIDEGCYDHPVVVLSPRVSPSHDVVILIVTSFGGTDVNDKFPNSIQRRLAYLPIHPAEHRDTNIQLYLQNSAQLQKKSYVNTREQHTLPFKCLVPYDRKNKTTRYVLTSESYQKLARLAEFELDATALHDEPQTPEPNPLPRTRTQPERFGLEPLHTHGTFHAPSAPPPTPPPAPRQEYGYITPTPARPYQSTDPLLPSYHRRDPHAWAPTTGSSGGGGVYRSRSNGRGEWPKRVIVCTLCTVCVVFVVWLGFMAYLLWSTSLNRANGSARPSILSSMDLTKFRWPGVRDLAVGARDVAVFVVRMAVW